ncbi:uncharacterized protein SAMN05216360_11539 [Methylobacterium phyllostachyos]|uniref:TPM domain-containing protein n=1 Tax=Methylobacterium phyllostachyos TaxID=582672 RepID=A0A1H0H179_9HYPH|nr:YgcG family protein [Methylobacterium phyllostachyos]SDO12865.1 uncharacterized protein SAMN05216360_11539 [Methylobacterium phyllostachyos]
MGRSIATRVRLVLALAVIAACLAVYAVGALAGDLTFPPLSGRVVDAAGLLTPDQRQALEAKLKAHADKTSDQVIVAIVPSLQGTTVEDYANRLFRTWQLGQAQLNNGVLLLVAPQEHKVRIEVGYGLEGALTDALSRTITSGAIKPRFKAGDYFGGLDAALDEILALLAKDAEEAHRKPLEHADAADPVQVALFIVLLLIVAVVAWYLVRAGGRASRAGETAYIPASGSSGWGGGFSDSGGSRSSDDDVSGGGGSSGGGGASDDW